MITSFRPSPVEVERVGNGEPLGTTAARGVSAHVEIGRSVRTSQVASATTTMRRIRHSPIQRAAFTVPSPNFSLSIQCLI